MSHRRNSSLITHELLLHDAASQGDDRQLDELKLFVKRGKFDINFKDEDWGERTALHCASERGNFFLFGIVSFPQTRLGPQKFNHSSKYPIFAFMRH